MWSGMKIQILRVLLAGAVCLPLTLAQNDAGRIVGIVTDSSGAVVPNVSITVTSEKTAQERKVLSDSTGHYLLPNLPTSTTYKITAEGSGFGKWETTEVPL